VSPLAWWCWALVFVMLFWMLLGATMMWLR